MTVTLGIIGLGQSGQRFLAAIAELSPGQLQVCCAADRDPRKLDQLRNKGIALYENYKLMLVEKNIDILIIATTDNEHYPVFKFIEENKIRFKQIICEKPVVTEPEEIQFLVKNFLSNPISVHFVERYSPTISLLKDYMREHQRIVKHVDFDWSKYRIKDPRPTVGVISEVTHPVDLALYLSGTECNTSYNVSSAWCQMSDFHIGGIVRPSSLFMAIEFDNGITMAGTSSYTRSRRRRSLEVILADKTGSASEIAVLNFDDPQWDDDQLTIYSLCERKQSAAPVLMHFRQDAQLIGQRAHISKICNFLETVIRSLTQGHTTDLADLHHGVYVQEIVANALKTASRSHLPLKFHEVSFDDASNDGGNKRNSEVYL